MLMDLSSIIQPHDLSHLDNPFTEEEITNVIKEMPIHKEPGPDDFNGKFLKKCWDLVKEDFMKLVNDFYEGISIWKASILPLLLLFLRTMILRL
jgi:hypothetical protein